MKPDFETTKGPCVVCGGIDTALIVDVAENGQQDEAVLICEQCALAISDEFEHVMEKQNLDAAKKLGW